MLPGRNCRLSSTLWLLVDQLKQFRPQKTYLGLHPQYYVLVFKLSQYFCLASTHFRHSQGPKIREIWKRESSCWWPCYLYQQMFHMQSLCFMWLLPTCTGKPSTSCCGWHFSLHEVCLHTLFVVRSVVWAQVYCVLTSIHSRRINNCRLGSLWLGLDLTIAWTQQKSSISRAFTTASYKDISTILRQVQKCTDAQGEPKGH